MGKKRKSETQSKKNGGSGAKSKAKKRAEKVWLAGLGALAAAGSEGERLFHGLVARGEEMEKRGKPVAEKLSKKATEARRAAEKTAAQVGDDAKDAWSKVETLLEEKVQSALHSRGYAGRDEVDALHKKIADLSARLAAAKKPTRRKPAKKAVAKKGAKTTAPAKAKKPAARTPPVKKTTVKKTTVKKSAAKKATAKKATARTSSVKKAVGKRAAAKKPAARSPGA